MACPKIVVTGFVAAAFFTLVAGAITEEKYTNDAKRKKIAQATIAKFEKLPVKDQFYMVKNGVIDIGCSDEGKEGSRIIQPTDIDHFKALIEDPNCTIDVHLYSDYDLRSSEALSPR